VSYPDFEEFIAALNARGVRYLVIGAYAVAYHAKPRATKDLDVYVDPAPANAKRLQAALRDFFGGVPPGYADSAFLDPEKVIQLGVAPVRIDLLARVSGLESFSSAWRRRSEGSLGSVTAHYVGFDDLVRSKAAANRTQDKADLEALDRVKRRRR
jgi:predicted nucleotidyltransferase